jgi:hypothetical protein
LCLVGIRERIKLQLQDDTDLEEVMAMAGANQHSIGAALPGLFQTLAAGWADHPKIVAAALTAAARHGPWEGMSKDIAKVYLLHFSHEPLRVDRRLFRLSHAAMAGSFSMA